MRVSNSGMRWWGLENAWEIREIHTNLCSGNLKERDQQEDLGADGRKISEWTGNKTGMWRLDSSGSG
jgi:hypothetical protein